MKLSPLAINQASKFVPAESYKPIGLYTWLSKRADHVFKQLTTDQMEGQLGIMRFVYEFDADGPVLKTVYLSAHPNKATVTVYRMVSGTRVPFTASARWKEYAQTDKDGNPVAMWKKMPYLMLAKVAEALALRKAFPNDLSGLYTNEEMAQADVEQPPQSEPVHYEVKRVVPPSEDEAGGSSAKQEAVADEIYEAQRAEIRTLLKDTLGRPARKEVIKELTGLDYTRENCEAIIKKLREIIDKTDPLAQVVNE